MGSDHPEHVKSAQKPGEDDLLGVIADVERQLESLKVHRADREMVRQKLEAREAELAQKDRELSAAERALQERAALLSGEDQRVSKRVKDIEASEGELAQRREKLERDFAALAEEQRRAADAAARQTGDIKAMTVALEQREQRLAEHAANISRQREQYEALGAELARRQEAAAANTAELEQARAAAEELKGRLTESERQSSARVAELDQVRQRAADLERRQAEQARTVEEARRQVDEQGAKLNEQLRVAKEEVRRAGEAQSALIAEVTERDQALEGARRELELIRAEAARRQAATTESENRLADFKRQVIERDTRIQELSGKLAAALNKFREISGTLQEQGSLAEQAQVLQDEIKKKDKKIAELSAGRPSADHGASRADLEALEGQLQQMREQLQESRNANRELKAQLAQNGSAEGGSGGVPEDVGEAIVTRWRRLRTMRSLLRQEGEKLQEASEVVRTRYAQAEQILAQRDQLAQARTSIAAAQEKVQKLQTRAAIGKTGMAMFYLVGAIAGLAALSWVIAGELAPARYSARAVLNADARGRQTSDDQLAEWQKYLESEVRDPRLHELAAERMARAGIATLASPGKLGQRLEADLIAESGVQGSLKLELRGSGRARTVRELDTFITTLVSQANATKERRPDGLGVVIAERPNADAGPISSNRMTYATFLFGVGVALCAGIGGATYRGLSKAKVRIEQEQDIDGILDNANWRNVEEFTREKPRPSAKRSTGA